MIIARLPQALPAGRRPDPPSTPPETRMDAFLRGTESGARRLSQISGFANLGSFGYLGGALLAGIAGTSGLAAAALGVGGALGVGLLGWKLGGKASDWAAAKVEAAFPKKTPEAQGQRWTTAAGRVALNLACDCLLGSPVVGGLNLVVSGLCGGWAALRHKKPG